MMLGGARNASSATVPWLRSCNMSNGNATLESTYLVPSQFLASHVPAPIKVSDGPLVARH